jgi:hypothetical protein
MKALPSKSLVLLIAAGMLGAPQVSYAAAVPSGKGTHYDAEWKTREALDPDYEVLQLTTSDALDNKMYLDVNPYVPSLNSVVFNSTRHDDDRDDDAENLYLMSLDDGTFVQLTDSDDIDGDHANVSPETEEAFFREGRTLKRVSLREPYREREIVTVDDRFDVKGILDVTTDGKTLAASLYDEDEDRTTLVTVDVGSGDMRTVKKIDHRVDHVLINPLYGDTLLYHVYEEHEIGVVDIDTGDKRVLTVPGDHGVHPFWQEDGVHAAYVDKTHDPRQIVSYDIRSEGFVIYDLPVDGNHFAMNPAQTILQSDGIKDKDNYIYYYKINPDDNTLDAKRMYKHDSSSDEESVHPHAAFINNHDLIFNSDRDDSGDVYLLRRK